MQKINIAEDFTRLPGPRYRAEGPHSGEQFRDELLLPRFLAARKAGEHLMIELDGAEFGYPTSFLEEAFGGLARVVGIAEAKAGLRFIATEEPLLIDEIGDYIEHAQDVSPKRASAR